MLYDLCLKHSIAGVCFCGIQQLPKEMMPPKEVLLRWFALAEGIRKRNVLLNLRAKELTERFAEGGFRSCVLKGQGIALLYDLNLILFRQSGDIDLWVDGERMKVLDYARSFGEVGLVDIKQADFKLFKDVDVEIHSIPTFFYSPMSNAKYRRWLYKVKDEQFTIGEKGFACPSIDFNVVYVLIHIYRHMFDEGVGLRQLMDYYFVLHNLNLDVNLNQNANATFRSLGMERFVGAVMWVMQQVFGMDRECLLCEPSEKYGKRFLDMVLVGGNFGYYDKRNRHGKENVLQRGFRNLSRNMLLVKDFPSEVLWAPFWKIWHYVWRMVNFGQVD